MFPDTKASLLALCVLLVVAAPAAGDDWPRWRGPDGNQVSSETGWDPAALDQPRVLWETRIGKGHSSFAVQGGLLVTTGNRTVVAGSETVTEEIVFCLDAGTGAERWRHSYRAPEGDTYSGPEGTPFIDGDRVYTAGRDGRLLCLDLATGRVLWQREVLADGLTTLHAWGLTSSPIVEGGLVLLNIGAAGAAFDKDTGETVWSSEAATCGFASPVVFTHDGERLAAMQGQETLSFVKAGTGEVVWSFPWNSYQDPTVLGERLFLAGGRDGTPKGSVMLAWTEDEPRVLWQHPRAEAAFQGWVVLGGHAYGFQRPRRQTFRCVRLADGEVVWEENLGDWGSFVVADGKLIVVTGTGELLIAEASPKGFEVQARAQVLQLEDHGEVHHGQRCFIWTHPVLANGLLYARNTDGDLVCVDLRPRQPPPPR